MSESFVKFAIFILIFFSILGLAIYVANRTVRLLRSLETAEDNSVSAKEKESARVKHLATLMLILLTIPSFLVASFISKFGFWNGYQISGSLSDWGQMGDFFGGMLNPILAFASFIALLYTIRIQSEELKLTRLEFEKSVLAQERMATEASNQQKYDMNSRMMMLLCEKLTSKTSQMIDAFSVTARFLRTDGKYIEIGMEDVADFIRMNPINFGLNNVSMVFENQLTEYAKNKSVYSDEFKRVINNKIVKLGKSFNDLWHDIGRLDGFSQKVSARELFELYMKSHSKDIGELLGFLYLTGMYNKYGFLTLHSATYEQSVNHTKACLKNYGGSKFVEDVSLP